MWTQRTGLRHFSARNFNHVRSPADFSQRLPIESAKCFCLPVILRWLISLAASAPAGRFGGQDALSPPRSPADALGSIPTLGWDEVGVTTRPHVLLCFRSERNPRGRSWQEAERTFARLRSRGDGGDERWGSDAAAWPKAQLRAERYPHAETLWSLGAVRDQPWLKGGCHNSSNEPLTVFQ